MEDVTMSFLIEGLQALTWQQLVMYVVGIVLIWLAIKKEYEPSLLLPMGFGAILVNLPLSGVLNQTLQGGISANGIIEWLRWVSKPLRQCRSCCLSELVR